MSLKDKLNEDMKNAMRAKDKDRLSVLRMILSEIKYAQAAVSMSQELPDDEVLKVVASYHKRLTKSLDEFPEESRGPIRAEIAVVEAYLPKKAGADEVRKVVDKVLAGTADRTFGPLMKSVLAELGGAADGKVVSQILKERLG